MKEHRNRLREPRLFTPRISKREKPFKWWSDPLKLVPIVMSVIAVTVSCLSWLESHRGRLISEEINRPILSLSRISAMQGVMMSEKRFHELRNPERFAHFDVYLNNIGKSTAQVQTINIEALMMYPEKCTISPRQGNNISDEVLPGTQGYFSKAYRASDKCTDTNLDFFTTEIVITYKDAGTGRQYSQSFGQLVRTLMDPEPSPEIENENKKSK